MTIHQMKSLIGESEKNIKELLAQQTNNGNKGEPQNVNKTQGNHDDGRGGQCGAGKHNRGQCYNCQQCGHMACECQNPSVPCSNEQQFPMTQVQELNVHAQTFGPTQYHATGPAMSQPVMLGPLPHFNQAYVTPRAPMVTNIRPPVNGMGQGPVMQAAPAVGQQTLN